MTAAPSPGRPSRISNLAGRMRYLALLAVQPGLRSGPRLTLGARVSVKIGRLGSLRRGSGVVFATGAAVVIEGTLTIEGPAYFGPGSSLTCFDAITIGSDFRCGEGVSFHDENHVIEPLSDLAARQTDYTTAAITVGRRVWVGARSIVLPGVTLGDDVVVAAGSVVTRDVPSGHLVAGVPARVIRPLTP